MFNIFRVAWPLSDSVPNLSLFSQINHRSRFFFLPQESICLVAGLLLAALELSIFLAGHAAVPTSTSGWKPSAGFLQYPLVWLFESNSLVNPSLLFQNSTLLSSSGAGQGFPGWLKAGAILRPRQSPGVTPTHSDHPWQEAWRTTPLGLRRAGLLPGFYQPGLILPHPVPILSI